MVLQIYVAEKEINSMPLNSGAIESSWQSHPGSPYGQGEYSTPTVPSYQTYAPLYQAPAPSYQDAGQQPTTFIPTPAPQVPQVSKFDLLISCSP